MATLKRPRDTNQLAKLIVDLATDGIDEEMPEISVKAGRLAGLKGGEDRAKKLPRTAALRSQRRSQKLDGASAKIGGFFVSGIPALPGEHEMSTAQSKTIVDGPVVGEFPHFRTTVPLPTQATTAAALSRPFFFED